MHSLFKRTGYNKIVTTHRNQLIYTVLTNRHVNCIEKYEEYSEHTSKYNNVQNRLQMKNIYQNNQIEEIAQGIHNINNNQIQQCKNKQIVETIATKTNTKYVPINATTTYSLQPLHMLAHHNLTTISHHPDLSLNIDIGVVLAHQQASDVDMPLRASHHKSRPSRLPTYNINTSDFIHTQYTTMLYTTQSQYYYSIDLSQHKRSAQTHLSNNSR